jgi:tetratricopeptide (TPR) repeat protein
VEAYFNDQYDKAIANFERCLRLDPSNSKARDYIAKARAKKAKIGGK